MATPHTIDLWLRSKSGLRRGAVFAYADRREENGSNRDTFEHAAMLHGSGVARCHVRRKPDGSGSEHILVRR